MSNEPVIDPLGHLQGWDADWSNLRVLVTGVGVTGFSVADTLAELGATLCVIDQQLVGESVSMVQTLNVLGVSDIRIGDDALSELPLIDGSAPDLVVTSPGWRPDHPVIAGAMAANVPVWSDIQLGRRLGARPGALSPQWLLITGTNGKTTTTAFLAAMLQADGRRAVACGNYGMPILDALRDPQGYDALAVELSSFQLHYTEDLGAEAAAVLNIADDHADWHGGAEGYIAAKAKIYAGTRIACVYNDEDPITEAMVRAADVAEGCRAIGFTTDTPEPSMLGCVEDILVDRAFLADRQNQALELASREDFGVIAPKHVVANALAAAALARAVDASCEAIQQAITDYEPAEHRIQPIAQADDVLWINDTKATNPHAAQAALESFRSVVWIAGGIPKGVDYDALIQRVGSRLRQVIVIGRDSSQLMSSLQRHAPQVPVMSPALDDDSSQRHDGADMITERASLEKLNDVDGAIAIKAAVALAHSVAESGDAVVLAPAAASMDQFRSYAHRGDEFIAAVSELMESLGYS